MYKLIVLFSFSLFLSTSEGVRCFVCTMAETDTTDLCLISPSLVPGTPSVECNLRYCTIRRQEYQNPQGRIASFHRGCESNPVHLNTMVDSEEFRTYYRACTSELCNTGNGIQPVNVNDGNSGSGIITLLVPGTGRSYSSITQPYKLLFYITVTLSSLLCIFY